MWPRKTQNDEAGNDVIEVVSVSSSDSDVFSVRPSLDSLPLLFPKLSPSTCVFFVVRSDLLLKLKRNLRCESSIQITPKEGKDILQQAGSGRSASKE